MKQRAKRLLSMVLIAAMLVSLFPAILTTTTHAADSGAFGISTPSAMTEEEKQAAANNPFGAMGNSAYPLLVKSELYLTYGWDGNDTTNGVNYVKSHDTTNNSGLPYININKGDNRVGYNKNDVGEDDNSYMAAAVDGFNPGGGKDEYVALLGLNARDRKLELSLTNKQGKSVSDYVLFERSGDGLKWLTDRELYQMNGFLSVACGDFDGDGKDSIIMYEAGAGNSQIPSLRECNVTKNGSRYDIEKGSLVMGSAGMYSVLGGDVSDMTKTEAKNAPKVQMEAADTDKDGYDELVVTVSMNDTHYGEKMKHLGTQVFIYDKLSSGWTLTARFSMKSTGVATNKDYADDRYRMVWGTSTVGNVIASDDSGVITDFPEIVTVGLQDNESKDMHNINVDGNDKLVYSIIHCTDMTEAAAGTKNYKGKYEAVSYGNLNANNFTKAGFYESEDVSPLLQTKCFSYKGAAEADAVFISGSVFAWESNGGDGELKHLYTTPFYDSGSKKATDGTSLTNMQVESIAAGNFDGNEDGREQIVSAYMLKQEGKNNGYSGLVTIGMYDNNWKYSNSPGGYYITRKGRAYVALTDFDFDSDSVIVKYESVEKQWSDPQVMAILAASPYFHDIGLDNNSCTDYGIDRSTETSSETSHSLTTNFVVGYEATTLLGNGGGVEATVENNLTWISNKSRTVTYSTNYSNNTESHQVVVYRSPTLLYKFTNVNNNKPFYLSKALSPVTSMISLEEYNEQADSYGLEKFDESSIGTPGIPNSYPSTKAQIANRGGANIMLGDNNWSNYSAQGTISKGVSTAEMKGESFNYEFEFSFTAYGLIFGAKIGGGAGYGYETTTSTVKGTEISRSGTVEGVQENGYDFNWNFASWSTKLNGLTIPVCGYLVESVTAPPSPAVNLNITDITADSLTLQWESGVRPAEKYNIYRVLEASTDPYLYIGSVSGDGDEFSYTLKGLDSGTTYTFVVRGASGDTESVDSASATACTSLTGGSNITINPLESTYSVAPNDSVTLSTQIFTSANFASLQLVWQTRAAGTGIWREISGATDTSLKLSNVTKSMDGNQYRLRVKATTTSANVGYYYSNTATLSVSTTGTAATLKINNASGGNGTLSPYDPYTGCATSTITEPQYETQMIEVPATFTVGSAEGQVYQVVGDPIFIGEIELEGTDGENPVKYYALTKNADGTYSAVGDALTVAERYIAESGKTVSMPDGVSEPLTMTTGTEENTVTYNAVALWNSNPTDSAPVYLKLWLQEQDGCYYAYDENTNSFSETDLTETSWSTYTVLGNISYSSADQVVVSGIDTYLLSGLGGAEGDVPTKTLVTSEDSVTVGEATYSLSRLDPITELESTQVITGYTTDIRTGTALTLTATLRKANGGQILSGIGADFVITDQTTGISQYVHQTSNSNGVITTQWTAETAGLYSIQVSIPGTTTLSSSLTAPQYYYASAQGSETQYRLRLKANGSDVAGSVSYGDTVSLVPESKTGTADWAALEIGEDSDLSLTAALQGGTVSTLTGTTYEPNKSGKYTITLMKTEGEVKTALATATLNVTPFKLTVTPVWEGVIPKSLADVDLKFTDASEKEITSLPNSDMTKLKGALVKSSSYNFTNPKAGIFYVDLSWSDESAKKDDITFLNNAYSITLSSASFYTKANSAPVRYGVVGGIGGSIFATGADYKSFASGESQTHGTPLRFQATPDTGYLVKSWKVNGVEVSANSANYVVTQISGGSAQQLTISSFDTTTDVSNGALLVEVEFANQSSTVTYSAGGQGSLTAMTSQGTAVQSGAHLAYGASVVFTAVPDEGQMVKEWKVTVNGETPETYTWPESGEIYRENTLTLSDLAEDSYTVYVEFTQKQTFTVASPVFVDGSGNPVNAGTITMTDASGEAVSAGDELEQGKSITYAVTFNDSNYNTVNAWEYSTDGTHWISDSDGGQLTYSCCKSSTGTLYVRAVVSVAQTYALTWKVVGLDEDDQASLSASSGGRDLTNGGSYAVNTPVSFQLDVDGKYYVAAWTNAEQSDSDPASAALTLTKDTEVTVTVAKKPTVSWTNSTGGTITVKGLVNGTDQNITSGSYVDYGTDITVTVTPDTNHVVTAINGTTVNSNKANGAQTLTVENLTADQSITASLTEKPTVTFTDSLTGGSVSVFGTLNGTDKTLTTSDHVDFNSSLTVTAMPADGYVVDSINDTAVNTGKVNGSKAVENIHVPESGLTVSAAFLAKPTVSIGTAEGGTVKVKGTKDGTENTTIKNGDYVDFNSSLTVTMTPHKGFEVSSPDASWTAVPDSDTYTYSIDVQTDQTIAPTFAAIPTAKVTYSVVDKNGTETGGLDGTLSVSISRKAMSDYAVTSDNDGTETVYRDSVVTFTATPASGYKVSKWFVNGIEQSNQPELTISSADAQDVQVQFDPVGEAVTYSFDTTGVTDQASLSAVYQANGNSKKDNFPSGNKPTANGVITFTVSDLADGYEVEGWYVNGVKQDNQNDLTYAYSVTANVGADVKVKIVRSSYAVTFSGKNGTVSATVGGIPISSGDSVVGGTEVTFIAAPVSNTGYSFSGWTVDGETSESTTESLTLTITHNTVVKAIYTLDKVRYTVNHGVIDNANGTLSAPALDAENTAAAGSDVVFTATPADGYRVKGWYSDVDGKTAIPGTTCEQNSYTLKNLLTDASVYVAFEPIPTYDITVTVTGLGTVTATVNGVEQEITDNRLTVTRYDDVVLTAVPGTYQYLTGWTLDGAAQGNDSMTLNLTDVTEAHTVTADFAASQLVNFRTVVVNAGDGTLTAKAGYGETLSTINAATGISVEKGKNVVVTAVPNTGYMVKAWTINGVVQDNLSNTLTIENLSEATIVKVEFEALKLWSITGSHPGCTLTIDEMTPSDYGNVELKQIRDRGNVTFTVRPDDDKHLTELTVNGTDCLTGIETSDAADKIIATVNSDNSVTITVTGVTHDIALTAASGSEIVIAEDSANGKVTANKTYAQEGDTVTLTVEPDKGYTLETLTVTDKNGDDIPVQNADNCKYTFTMPASKVMVKATFMEDNSMLNFFVDVPITAYYYDAVLWAAESGITVGTSNTTFSPNTLCTRAQIVTFLWRSAGSPAPESSVMPFTDVAEGSYYYDAVLWALENGITSGSSSTTFSPNAKCTRAQAITFLWNYQGAPTVDTVNPFTDVPANAYYADAVLWAVENGITAGTSATTFSPQKGCTRGQIVSFLYRCLNK